MTFDGIVSAYIREHRENARKEMRFFENQRHTPEVIRKAALCELPDGKRHPHQYRIPRLSLEQAEARLQSVAKKLVRARDFGSLHDLVEAEIASIYRVSELTIYDIAHRIGAYLRKAPRLVYLHRGTRIGATAFGLHGRTIDPKQLPAAFFRLTPAEIEDCLCIYKDELKADRGRTSSGGPHNAGQNPCQPRHAARKVGCKR